MAVMGRKKQMVARIIQNRRTAKKDLEDEEREKMKEKEAKVSEEEHEARLKMLKDLGLVK